eukprot:GHVT01048024.1.p2 GENE.GHVT01048024.1~~GHVT01048024.1.p2  ORF type:complete len:111 (+),score=27.22 GHVT01048024.1:1342-1674(+)
MQDDEVPEEFLDQSRAAGQNEAHVPDMQNSEDSELLRLKEKARKRREARLAQCQAESSASPGQTVPPPATDSAPEQSAEDGPVDPLEAMRIAARQKKRLLLEQRKLQQQV